MRLTKEEKAEGITDVLVKSINMNKQCSPVQLLPGDEPQKLMKCSSGYWVKLDDGSFLKDENNRLMVFPERECIVGRARYLLNFGIQEKAEKVDALIESWKGQCRDLLDQIKQKIDSLKLKAADLDKEPDGMLVTIAKIYRQENPAGYQKEKEWAVQVLETELPKYENAEVLYAAGDFHELIPILGIREFPIQMFSAHHDNSLEMTVLKNVFGRDSIEKWTGDTVRLYAQIEIEKQYAGL